MEPLAKPLRKQLEGTVIKTRDQAEQAARAALMHPDGVAVSLAECDDLAQYEDAADGWELAGRYASLMLPQIFRPDSPVLALRLVPEHQRALEQLLAGLSSDSLG